MGSNGVVHFEIPADQPEALIKFYIELFGWKFQKSPHAPTEYWLCETGSDEPGINGAVMQRQQPQQPVPGRILNRARDQKTKGRKPHHHLRLAPQKVERHGQRDHERAAEKTWKEPVHSRWFRCARYSARAFIGD